MKKLFALAAILGMFVFGVNTQVFAQGEDSTKVETNLTTPGDDIPDDVTQANEDAEQGQLHRKIKEKFIEGGPFFMSFVLLALILGLALSIERIIYLNLADVNTEKLLLNVEEALETGGVEAAKEVCRDTRGPVASIFYQGLSRADQGIDVVEKSVISYGSVQMGLLERGLTWISLFISLAPMLGFMGTVIGMISAFDSIQAAGDVNAQLVAGGIKVALITTVSGLIVAMILQIFYNYIVSKVDAIVSEMEDTSISLIDILVKYQNK
ncbi:MAG: MotA/TolQ/ExbB proton channel family protein [Bacteroidales bacterium]|nr:MotA/TolQ/ExbB proton channel family protein [Bacteroidales bacterium]